MIKVWEGLLPPEAPLLGMQGVIFSICPNLFIQGHQADLLGSILMSLFVLDNLYKDPIS